MGTPKALLTFDGIPLILHTVATLRRVCAEIVVVAAPDQAMPPMDGVTLVRDEVAYQGPVRGLYHGLSTSTRSISFVASCDSPFINTGVVSHLLSFVTDYDVVVPRWGGRDQPLHGVYRRTVLPALEAQLANGELRLGSFLDKVRARRMDADEIRTFDPEGLSFLNVNTPEDYDEARRLWSRRMHASDES